MNYLAHALLSSENPPFLVGNLWGDLIRPPMYGKLDEKVLQGIHFHKWIDQFTDEHPLNRLVRDILRPHQYKYTPVVSDVLMDFLLSKFWDQYSSEPLLVFCDRITRIAREHIDYVPEILHYRISRMMDNNWLASCRDEETMKITLSMLSKRVHFENAIPDLIDHYKLEEEKINEAFFTFFADLRETASLRNEDLS